MQKHPLAGRKGRVKGRWKRAWGEVRSRTWYNRQDGFVMRKIIGKMRRGIREVGRGIDRSLKAGASNG